MPAFNFFRKSICYVSISLAVFACDGRDYSVTVEDDLTTEIVGINSSVNQSANNYTSSSSGITPSSQSGYTSSSRRLSDIIEPQAYLELGVKSIDQQGLTIAFNKEDNILFFGAIHGKQIQSLSTKLAPNWIYTGEQRLFSLTLTDDERFLLAAFEYEIKVLVANTGEVFHTIPTPRGPASDVLATTLFGHSYFYVTGEDGTETIEVVGQSQPNITSYYDTAFDTAVDLESHAHEAPVWVQKREEDKSLYIKCTFAELSLCVGESPSYQLDEPEGGFKVSTDGHWLITLNNTVLSTTLDSEPYKLDGRDNHPGFLDMDFNKLGVLGVIDTLGDAYAYTSIEPNSSPIKLEPKNKNISYHLERIITLDDDVFAIARTEPGGYFWFIALSQPLINSGNN